MFDYLIQCKIIQHVCLEEFDVEKAKDIVVNQILSSMSIKELKDNMSAFFVFDGKEEVKEIGLIDSEDGEPYVVECPYCHKSFLSSYPKADGVCPKCNKHYLGLKI